MLFQNVVNKAQQTQQRQQNYNQNYSHNANQNTTQAKIKVDYKPEGKKGTIPDSEGEFIDYEEVK